MITINNIVFCDSTQQLPTPDGKSITLLVNPMPELRPPYIPGVFSFSVSFGLSGLKADEKTEAIITFSDPVGKPLSVCSVPILLPKEALNLTGCVDLRNVLLESEGSYSLTIQIDNMHSSQQITVKKGVMA